MMVTAAIGLEWLDTLDAEQSLERTVTRKCTFNPNFVKSSI